MDPKIKAMIEEVEGQRTHAQTRCAHLAAELAVAKLQIDALQAQIEELKANAGGDPASSESDAE